MKANQGFLQILEKTKGMQVQRQEKNLNNLLKKITTQFLMSIIQIKMKVSMVINLTSYLAILQLLNLTSKDKVTEMNRNKQIRMSRKLNSKCLLKELLVKFL
jgi:ABC-type branched-subunit amino acid transport system ATPase component